jgi:hypothetical protein
MGNLMRASITIKAARKEGGKGKRSRERDSKATSQNHLLSFFQSVSSVLVSVLIKRVALDSYRQITVEPAVALAPP